MTVSSSPPLSGPSPATLDALHAELATGEAERERDRIPPFDAVRAVARTGLGTVRVPTDHGGPGWSLRRLFEAVVDLAQADSNVAQALRAHFHFVEGRRNAADPAERDRWFPVVLRGELFGNGTVERRTKDIFGFETTLTPAGDHHVLTGTKYYSTGSLYADHVAVTAQLPDGSNAVAIVPADREGVALEDDWDGMGQRLTASGTSRFEAVRVEPDEVLVSPIGKPTTVPRAAFLQLYLVAVMAGIGGAVAAEAGPLVRGRGRTFSHAAADTASADPQLQQVAGELSASAFAARAVVLAAAEALDVAEATAVDGTPDPDATHEAAVLAAQAQVACAQLVPAAAQQLFDLGGASVTARGAGLDRHWRNARTLANHNPAMYKARAIGDLRINGTPLPPNGFF